MPITDLPTTGVFYQIANQLAGAPLKALVAYGIFEQDRIAAEEKRLTQDKTFDVSIYINEYDVNGAIARADEMLSSHEMLISQTAILEKILLQTSRNSRFWPAFISGTISGIVANLAFIILVLIGWVVFQLDPSPFTILKQSMQKH